MKITKAKLVYTLLSNIPITFFVCLVSAIFRSLEINWTVLGINFLVGYPLAVYIGLFFPLKEIGKWFTNIFKIETISYKGNMKYRLLAVFIITLLRFTIVSIALTILNYFLLSNHSILEAFFNWLRNFIPLLLVAYIVTLISDYLSRIVANKIDEDF